MLYGCATWTLRPMNFKSVRAAHPQAVIASTGSGRKGRTRHKALSCGAVLEISCERIETAIRKCQLWFAGAIV